MAKRKVSRAGQTGKEKGDFGHLKTVIIILVVVFLWLQMHEIWHAAAMSYEGLSFTENTGIITKFTCTNCQNATPLQIAFLWLAPYFIDIVMMLGGLLFTRKWTYALANIAFFDLLVNTSIFFFVGAAGTDFAAVIAVGRLSTAQTLALVGVFTGIIMNIKYFGRIIYKEKFGKD